ncbi:MAG TPA: protein kinase [Blastocatellia bacterium]|nr:protein kinase [Blastocatellia bacterium]
MIGRIIGNYQITSELAQGGMGAVYRGRHLHLPREVVVKSILLGAFSPSAQSHLKARFRREAFIQSQLDHPNIVRVYEFFAAEDNYFLVMEYVPGMSLRDLLSRQGAPTPAQAVYLLKQALSALDFAYNFSYLDESEHRHTGIIHRDIKPANMLLDTLGKLKLTDFGIVKVMGEETGLAMTQSGFHPGTVEYMSPEQLLGHEIDIRSDIYSLGVTFYEIITGRLPFRRSATGSDWEIRKGHIELEPPPILDIRAEVPPQLAAIIMRSLRKNPDDRYQSAAEFLDTLQVYEQYFTGRESTLRSPSVRPTERQTTPLTMEAVKSTLLDESATLLAPQARDDSPSTRKPHLEDEATALLKSEAATLAAAPAPASPEPSVDKIAPRSSGGQSGRKLPLAIGGAGLLLAGTAAGAIFFSQQRPPAPAPRAEAAKVGTASPTLAPSAAPASSPIARATIKPKSPATPAPAAVEKMNFKLAQSLEQRESYEEAIKLYEDYLDRNPLAADANIVSSYMNELRKMQIALALGDKAMSSRMYPAARKHYLRALTLRPNSQRANDGLAEAETNIKRSLPPAAKRQFPFDQQSRPEPGPRRDHPSDQHNPPRAQRRISRPTPTPREQKP